MNTIVNNRICSKNTEKGVYPMNKKWLSGLLIFSLLVFSSLVFGCADGAGGEGQKTSETPLTKNQKVEKEITLYFSDDQAMYLQSETRLVTIEKDRETEQLPAAVINELIAGPKDSNLYRTIPPEAKLLGIEIKDGIAYVNFSEELRTRHWGGSTGEAMTMGSIVNSLTELNGIEKVLVLINGETQETLVGHLDISQPSGRIESMLNQ